MAYRWTEISADPNSAKAHAYRLAQLKKAHQPPTRSRDDYLASLARGKRVLDVGCVDHLDPSKSSAPLHRSLASVAREVVGVDFQPAGIESLRAEGFDARLADVTQPGLEQVAGTEFDLVVAGEIVEHLLDLSVFFENVKSVLTTGGLLALSTPNPHSLYLTARNLAGRPSDNVDHVTYHWPSGVAEIADRLGFELVEVRGVRRLVRRSLIQGCLWAVGRVVSFVSPAANAECMSLLYLLRPRR